MCFLLKNKTNKRRAEELRVKTHPYQYNPRDYLIPIQDSPQMMDPPPTPDIRVYDFEVTTNAARSQSRASNQTYDSTAAAAGLRDAWSRTSSRSLSTIRPDLEDSKKISVIDEINSMQDDLFEKKKTKLRCIVQDFQSMVRRCGIPRKTEHLIMTPKKIANTLTTQRMRGMEQWVARAVIELICNETDVKISYFECLEALAHKSLLIRHLFSETLSQTCKKLPIDTQTSRNNVFDMLQRWELCSTFSSESIAMVLQQYQKNCSLTPIKSVVAPALVTLQPPTRRKIVEKPIEKVKKSPTLLLPSARPERVLNPREQLLSKKELRQHQRRSDRDRAEFKRKMEIESEREFEKRKRMQIEEEIEATHRKQNTPTHLLKYDGDDDDFDTLIGDSMSLILGQDQQEKSQIAQEILSGKPRTPQSVSSKHSEEEFSPIQIAAILHKTHSDCESDEEDDRVIMYSSGTKVYSDPPRTPIAPKELFDNITSDVDVISAANDEEVPQTPQLSSQFSLLEKLLPADSQVGSGSQYEHSLLPDCSDLDAYSQGTSALTGNTNVTGDLTKGAFLGATDRSRNLTVKNVIMHHAVERKIERQRKSIVELTKQTYNHRRFEEGDYLGAVYGATKRTEVDLTAQKSEVDVQQANLRSKMENEKIKQAITAAITVHKDEMHKKGIPQTPPFVPETKQSGPPSPVSILPTATVTKSTPGNLVQKSCVLCGKGYKSATGSSIKCPNCRKAGL